MATQELLPIAETPLGKLGRVTKGITYRGKGEIEIDSGTFVARADNPRDEFFVGTVVRVVDVAPGLVFVEEI